MAKYEIKEGADVNEGISYAFNLRLFAKKFQKDLGTENHENKLLYEESLDRWLEQNVVKKEDAPKTNLR